MVQQIDYQFIQVPMNLFYLMDANCSKVLTTLIQMNSFYPKKDGYFECAYKTLELACGMSRPVIKASLAGLYLEGIIDVVSVGQGKGKNTNRYKVNVEKFKDYEKINLGIAIMTEDKPIHQAKYKGERFQVPWVEKQSEKETEKQSEKKVTTNIDNIPNIENKSNIDNLHNTKEDNLSKDIGNTLGKRIGKKVTTNTDTTDTSNSIDIINTKENNISKDIENDLQKVNTCYEGNLPTCKIDIIQEEKSLKEFEEESLKDMKDSFNIVCTKVKINEDMLIKGFECCSNFYDKYQNLDYQLLLNNPQQFLTNNEIKLGSLSQSITTYTGVTVSKQITTQILKDYVELAISK